MFYVYTIYVPIRTYTQNTVRILTIDNNNYNDPPLV